MMKSMFEFLGISTSVRCARRSSQWPKVRNAHLEQHPACISCGDLKNHKKEVHHIVPVHFDRSRELDPSNLVTLCDEPCHLHDGHLGNWQFRNPNVVETCAERLAAVQIAREEINRMVGMGMTFDD